MTNMYPLDSIDYAAWGARTLLLLAIIFFHFYINVGCPKLPAWRTYIFYRLTTTIVYFSVIQDFGYFSVQYNRTWSIAEIIGYLIVMILCVELSQKMLSNNREVVIFYSGAMAVMLVITLKNGFSSVNDLAIIGMMKSSMMLSGFLLLVSMFWAKEWRWPYAGISLGLIVHLALQYACSWFHAYSIQHSFVRFSLVRNAYDLAAIISLSIWLYTASHVSASKPIKNESLEGMLEFLTEARDILKR